MLKDLGMFGVNCDRSVTILQKCLTRKASKIIYIMYEEISIATCVQPYSVMFLIQHVSRVMGMNHGKGWK